MSGWNPGAKYSMYIKRIQGLLGEEKRTVRDVYYALEARGFEEELREESYSRAHGRIVAIRAESNQLRTHREV